MAEKKKTVAAPEASDRKKALETAIAKIEKDYGKGTIMRLGDDISVNVEALSTGSLSLDFALGIGGVLIFEVGEGQADDVCEMLMAAGFNSTAVRRDARGVERVVIGRI